MSSADLIEVEGVIVGQRGSGKYSVRLDNGVEVIGYLTGKLAGSRISVTIADRVKVGLSPYDLTTGRITWRL